MSSATFFQPSRGINKMQPESYAMEKLSSPASPLSRWNWFSAVADAKVCPSMLYLDYSACFFNQWIGEDLDGETVIQDLCFWVVLTTIYPLSSIFVHFHTFTATQPKPSFQLFGAELHRNMFECVGQKLLGGQWERVFMAFFSTLQWASWSVWSYGLSTFTALLLKQLTFTTQINMILYFVSPQFDPSGPIKSKCV